MWNQRIMNQTENSINCYTPTEYLNQHCSFVFLFTHYYYKPTALFIVPEDEATMLQVLDHPLQGQNLDCLTAVVYEKYYTQP